MLAAGFEMSTVTLTATLPPLGQLTLTSVVIPAAAFITCASIPVAPLAPRLDWNSAPAAASFPGASGRPPQPTSPRAATAAIPTRISFFLLVPLLGSLGSKPARCLRTQRTGKPYSARQPLLRRRPNPPVR